MLLLLTEDQVVALHVFFPTVIAILIVAFIIWMSVFCVYRYEKKRESTIYGSCKNNGNRSIRTGDSTDDDLQHRSSKWLWLLWILTILNFVGIVVAVVLAAVGVHYLKGLDSYWKQQQGIIPAGSQIQLDYNGPVWSLDYFFEKDKEFNVSEARNEPSTLLLTHAVNTARQREYLERPKGNTTFWAPVLRCQDANDLVIANATRRFGKDVSHRNTLHTSYAAWVPGDQFATQELLPSQEDSSHAPKKTIDEESLDTKRIFVMTNSGETTKIIRNQNNIPLGIVNVTECRLGNASLSIDFDNAHYKASDWSLPFKYDELTETTAGEVASYTALMNAFDKILVGQLKIQGVSNDLVYSVFNPPWGDLSIDWTRAEKVQRGLEEFFQNITINLLSDPSFSKTVTL